MKPTHVCRRKLALISKAAFFFVLCCANDAAAQLRPLDGGNPNTKTLSRPLTNADIIQMSEESLPEQKILEWIEKSESEFDVSPYGVIQLHDAGVSLRVIEAMQRVRAVKPASQQPAAVSDRRPPGLPRPPVQQVGSFAVALDGCNAAGTTVTCYFTVTNTGAERKLFVYAYGSKLIDSVGRRVVSRAVGLNDVQGANAQLVTFPNDTVKGWVRFTDAQPTSRKNASLSLHFFSSPPGSFDVEFNDVRLEGAGELAPLNIPPQERRPSNSPDNSSPSRPRQVEDAVKSGRRIMDAMRGRRP